MSAHLDRARLLLDHGRAREAASSVTEHLASSPEDWRGHALMAWCHNAMDEHDAALESAGTAIGLAPGEPEPQHVRAAALLGLKRPDDATGAVREAITLDPGEAEYYGLLGVIHGEKYEWKKSLEACETGLELDPDNTLCQEFRTIALTRLGRRDEASSHAADSLRKTPDSAITHANAGWAALHRGKHGEAKTHFLEALRLDPDNEWSRAGAVEALKAKNPIYRVLLRFRLWMVSLSPGVRFGVVIGGLVMYNVVRNLQGGAPALRLVLAPLVIAYLLFVLLTWVGDGFFNLLLLPSRLGRRAMSPEQRRGGVLFGVILALGLLVGAGETALAFVLDTPYLPFFAIMTLMALVPAGMVYQVPSGRRPVFWLLTLAVLTCPAGQAFDLLVRTGEPRLLPWFPIALWTAVGSVWVANLSALRRE